MKSILVKLFIAKYFQRIPFCRYYYRKLLLILKNTHGLKIALGEIRIVNYYSIQVNSLLLKENKSQRIYSLKKTAVNLKLTYLIFGKLEALTISSEQVLISQLTPPLTKMKQADAKKNKVQTLNINTILRLFTKVLNINTNIINIQILKCNVIYRKWSIIFRELSYQHCVFYAKVTFPNKQTVFILNGSLRVQRKNEINFSISDEVTNDLGKTLRNFPENAGLGNFNAKVTKNTLNPNKFEIEFKWEKTNALKNDRIGYKSLTQNISGRVYFHINRDYILLDRSSTIEINNQQFAVHFEIDKSKDIEAITFQLLLREGKVKNFIDLLRHLKYYVPMKKNLKGRISFILSLKFQLDNPMNYFFDMQIKHNLSITFDDSFSGLKYLTDPFTHTIQITNGLNRDIQINTYSDNDNLLQNISDIFIKILLISEDRYFFSHNGFDKNSIGYALISNIIDKKFSRGASTITMQLAKNLFLNTDKNIFRKLDEMFLTWLIEDIHKIPKKRILELYLNIIEFGPNIYGIIKAASFYFGKKPIDLTFLDSLIITYIIPRPKHFIEALLIKSIQLEQNLKIHLQKLSHEAYKLGYINEEEIISFPIKLYFSPNLGNFEIR